MARSSTRRTTLLRRSPCPVACTLDLIGDRWTLLIIRDIFFGKSRYGEFLASPEGIPTNILADRLSRLEEAGIVSREPYQQNPPRHAYTLTAKGAALQPLLGAVAQWGRRHIPGTSRPINTGELAELKSCSSGARARASQRLRSRPARLHLSPR